MIDRHSSPVNEVVSPQALALLSAPSEGYLLTVAEVSATLAGLFLVGVFFLSDTVSVRRDTVPQGFTPYLRASTRLVLLLYGLPLVTSLVVVGFGTSAGRITYAVGAGLIVLAKMANLRIARTVLRRMRSPTMVAIEAGGTVLVLMLAVLPWTLDGLRARSGSIAVGALISLGAAAAATVALPLEVFDLAGSPEGSTGPSVPD